MSRGRRRRRPSADRRGRAPGPARGRQRGRRRGRARCSTSFVAESPLTGSARAASCSSTRRRRGPSLLDFFVAAPGARGRRARRGAGPDRRSTSTTTPRSSTSAPPPAASRDAGRARARRSSASARCRWPSWRRRRRGCAREGVAVNAEQAYFLEILDADPHRLPRRPRALRAQGRILPARATSSASRSSADALERFAAEGAEPFYAARSAAPICDWVLERGGTLGARRPGRLRADRARAGARPLPRPRGAHQPAAVLGRHPDRLRARAARAAGGRSGVEELVAAMEAANAARGDEFHEGLHEEGYASVPRRPASTTSRGVAGGGLAARAGPRTGSARPPTSRCSTPTAICASVTCSNGTGSGVLVPGTGVHLNNMLGEEDLNPLGFHRTRPGRAAALDDVADGRPARRRGRSPGSAAPARTGSARRSCRRRSGCSTTGWTRRGGRGAPASTSRPAPSRPSRASTRRRWPGSRRRGLRGGPLAASATSSSAACRPSRGTRPRASSAAAATRAAAAPSWLALAELLRGRDRPCRSARRARRPPRRARATSPTALAARWRAAASARPRRAARAVAAWSRPAARRGAAIP